MYRGFCYVKTVYEVTFVTKYCMYKEKKRLVGLYKTGQYLRSPQKIVDVIWHSKGCNMVPPGECIRILYILFL